MAVNNNNDNYGSIYAETPVSVPTTLCALSCTMTCQRLHEVSDAVFLLLAEDVINFRED